MNHPKWELLKADRSWSNESNGAEMAGCIAESGRVVAYLPNHFRDAPLICAAPELLEALEACLPVIESERDALASVAGLGDAVHDELHVQTCLLFEKMRSAIAKARGL